MARISWVVRDLRGGGAERTILRIVSGLCERGHRVDLVLFFPISDYPDEMPDGASVFVLARPPGRWSRMRRRAANLLRKNKKRYRSVGVPEHARWTSRTLPLSRLPILLFLLVKGPRWPIRDLARRVRRADFIRALRLGRYLEERKPDVVFSNLWQADMAGFFASFITRNCPAIVPVVRDTLESGRTAHFDLIQRILLAAGHVMAVSRGVAENVSTVVGIPENRIAVIHNPAVAPEIVGRAGAAPDHLWFRDGGPPVVLGVGRLAPQKDFPALIEAFRRVLSQRPCRLVILGEGPMRHDLEERVSALGLEDSVLLPGWVENPYAFMARAALFVLSSRHEGFPGALVEALACGCPAVSTDCPSGPSEILEDPDLLAPVGDPEALARVMLRALARPTDKTALRASAARFDLESAMDGYGKVVAALTVRDGERKQG